MTSQEANLANIKIAELQGIYAMSELLKKVTTSRYASANIFELSSKRSGSPGEQRIAFEATVDRVETWTDAIKAIASRRSLFRVTMHPLIRSLEKVKFRIF